MTRPTPPKPPKSWQDRSIGVVLRTEGVRNYVLLSNYRKLGQRLNGYSRTGVRPAICRIDVFAHSVRVPCRRVPNSDLGREALLSMSGKPCTQQPSHGSLVCGHPPCDGKQATTELLGRP